jgi:hypothetical protein
MNDMELLAQIQHYGWRVSHIQLQQTVKVERKQKLRKTAEL